MRPRTPSHLRRGDVAKGCTQRGSQLRGITAGYRRLTDGNFSFRGGPDGYHMDDDGHEGMQASNV